MTLDNYGADVIRLIPKESSKQVKDSVPFWIVTSERDPLTKRLNEEEVYQQNLFTKVITLKDERMILVILNNRSHLDQLKDLLK